MKKVFLLLLACLLLSVFTFSCESETQEIESINLRSSFLKDKTFTQIKGEYKNLNTSEKLKLWDEKLSQILKQNLDSATKELIFELKKELNTTPISEKKIKEIGVKLAENLSFEEFELMFTTLDDYEPYKINLKTKSIFFSDQISNNEMSFSDNIVVEEKQQFYQKIEIDCSCNWTCSTFCSESTSDCKPTSTGCGFLWAFECEYACAL